jgi:mRNA interferase RelE/StbE
LGWTIDYTETARQQLKKLDRNIARRILDTLEQRISIRDNPRELGKALGGSLGTLWRYRVGDYRVICDLEDSVTRILVLQIGHRREVYR